MQWKFFLGACLLMAAVLQPHAPAKSLAGGVALAALARWVWTFGIVYRQRRQGGDASERASDD